MAKDLRPYLLVGGPHDGKRGEVEDGVDALVIGIDWDHAEKYVPVDGNTEVDETQIFEWEPHSPPPMRQRSLPGQR
jgi:hypothetical protein